MYIKKPYGTGLNIPSIYCSLTPPPPGPGLSLPTPGIQAPRLRARAIPGRAVRRPAVEGTPEAVVGASETARARKALPFRLSWLSPRFLLEASPGGLKAAGTGGTQTNMGRHPPYSPRPPVAMGSKGKSSALLFEGS